MVCIRERERKKGPGQKRGKKGGRKSANKKVHLCLGRPEYTVEVNFYGQVVEENGKRKWVNQQVIYRAV